MTVPPGRIVALTGLRGIAVALVVLAHAHVRHLGVGLFGVDVFFVLSGFLITHVLLGLQPFGVGAWGSFLGRRAARLLPALGVTLVGMAGWALVIGHAGTCFALAATHTMDLPIGRADGCSGPFHITWSLAAEEQFYLLWPPLVVVLSRLPARRAAAWCVGAYVGAWALAGLVTVAFPHAAGWWNYFPAGRPTALLLGAALAFLLPLHGRMPALDVRARQLAVPLFLAGLVVTGVLLERQGGPRQVLLGPLVAVPSTLLIAKLVVTPMSPFGRSRVLVWLGEISYSLYLVHVLALHATRRVSGDDSALTNAVGVLVALAAAWALHRFVEQPVRLWGYAWLSRRERAPEPVRTPTLVG